jgi:hypothetical protein
VGFLDAIRGRKAPTRPHLDALFALPSAAITLDVDLGLTPTGVGSVCFRGPEGRAFSDLETQVRELLDADGGPRVEANADEFGFDWLTVRTEPADLAGAVTDIHAVNTSLARLALVRNCCVLFFLLLTKGVTPSHWCTSTSGELFIRSHHR